MSVELSKAIYQDLILSSKLIYDACGFEYTTPVAEAESAEYAAAEFKVNGKSIKYRAAKITPTKTGQFVTIWKRNAKGETAPFDSTDDIGLVVISTRSDKHFGQFIFPKAIMLEKGIMSENNKEGKRGIRVYPPWDVTTNKQAQKTQAWQLEYFLEIPEKGIDLNKAKKLYL